VWVGLAQRQHVELEVLSREQPRRVEDRDVEILLERHRARFELAHDLMVAVLEVLVFNPELLEGPRALLSIPSVGAEDAADVEENVRERQLGLRGGCRNLHRKKRGKN